MPKSADWGADMRRAVRVPVGIHARRLSEESKERAHEGPHGFVISGSRLIYAGGGLLFPLGGAAGGHGVPGVGLIPGLLGDVPLVLLWPFAFPGVDWFAPEAPGFGVEPVVPFAVPGKVPHGDPVGEPPGLFGVLGLAEG